MTDAAEKLKSMIDALTFEDRNDLRHYLASLDEVSNPAFSPRADKAIDQVLELDWQEQLAIADLPCRIHACPPGVLSEDDPRFLDILNERVRQFESGQCKGIPAEEVFAGLDERLKLKRRRSDAPPPGAVGPEAGG